MKKLIITLFLLMAALQSIAQTQFWYHGVHYEMTNSYSGTTVIVISADATTYSGTITIPEIVRAKMQANSGGGEFEKALTVVGIGYDAFNGCTGLTEVILPSTVTSVGSRAFYGCTGLTRIELPSRLSTIGSQAFYGCSALTSITLPKGLNDIMSEAFRGCTGLTNVTMRGTKTIGQRAFSDCTSLSNVTFSNKVNTIESQAFSGCTSLNNVVIPNSVVTMNWNVFYGCTGLTNVTLSENVPCLLGTFSGCSALTSVTVPVGVVQIDGAFKGCTSLTSVKLPPLLNTIGSEAFDGCTSLASIYIPNSVATIGARAFSNTALTELELPSTVKTVNDYAFYGCNSLVAVKSRPLSPPSLYSNSFSSETFSLATLHIPTASMSNYTTNGWWKKFENIEGEEAYNTTYDFISGNLTYLITGNNTVCVMGPHELSGTDLSIPASVTHNGVTYSVTAIAPDAFSNCSLESLSLPESLITIGKHAFYQCSGLTFLTIPVNVTSIGEGAFDGLTNLTQLVWNARECRTTGMNYEKFYDYYVFYDYENSYSEYYNSYKTNLVDLTIGNEVKVLPAGLAAHSQITSVDIPASVVEICDDVFYDCIGLTSLEIPVNVTTIRDGAFSFCRGLTSLTWNARRCENYGGLYYEFHPGMTGYYDDTHEVISNFSQLTIGDEVEVLPKNFARNTSITSVQLPSSLQSVGDYAFYNCWNLDGSITLGDAVIEVGDKAFGGCEKVNALTVGKNVEFIGEDAFGSGQESSTGYWVPRMRPFSLIWNARHCKSCGNLDYSNMIMLTIGDEVEILPNRFAESANRTSTINIPASVRVIGSNAFSSCNFITSLTLPNTIREIGDEAFKYCSRMTDVTLPDSLTTIGSGAFSRCYNLTGLYLPASVTSFGEGAFKYCDAMTWIVVDAANPVYDSREDCNAIIRTADEYILLTCKNTTLPSTLTSIADYAFYNNGTLTRMDIPSSILSIGKYAFAECYNLTDVTMANSVTTIGRNAFSWCGQLANINLSSSLTSIEPYTFAYCYSLTSIEVPVSVTSVAKTAFLNTNSLDTLSVADGNSVFDSRDNSNAIIETASNKLILGSNSTVIPETVTAIGDSAFFELDMPSITIPSAIERVDYNAFDGCYSLNRVDISDLGAWCRIDFANAAANPLKQAKTLYLNGNLVTDVEVPAGATSVKPYVFTYCSKLASVSIPNSVDTIGRNAFSNCQELRTASLSNTLKFIGDSAFYYCNNLTSVTIPNTVDTIGYHSFAYCKNMANLRLSASLKYITNRSFYECDALTSVSVPNSVEKIGREAFYGCDQLASVTIGKSVNKIDYDAFFRCNALNRVVCLATTPPIIDYYSFYGNVLENGTLFVPQGTMAAYKAAPNWKRFKNIQEIAGAGPGDVNGDGDFSISDVSGLIDLLINGNELPIFADVDGDGRVTVKDVTELINMLLSMN